MPSTVKKQRNANALRRTLAASRQQPLSAEKQKEIAEANAAAKAAKYPVPPCYRMSYKQEEPAQPDCYQSRKPNGVLAVRGLKWRAKRD